MLIIGYFNIFILKDNGSEETFLNKVAQRVRRVLTDRVGLEPGDVRQNGIDLFEFENYGEYQITTVSNGAIVFIFPDNIKGRRRLYANNIKSSAYQCRLYGARSG